MLLPKKERKKHPRTRLKLWWSLHTVGLCEATRVGFVFVDMEKGHVIPLRKPPGPGTSYNRPIMAMGGAVNGIIRPNLETELEMLCPDEIPCRLLCL